VCVFRCCLITKIFSCNGASVEPVRGSDATIEEFRQAVRVACTSSDKVLVVSYDRQKLKQTGSGHFSPLGGYHEPGDMVLILDVARFKYPPHWIPLSVMYEALQSIDAQTGKSRGYFTVSRASEVRPSVLLSVASPLQECCNKSAVSKSLGTLHQLADKTSLTTCDCTSGGRRTAVHCLLKGIAQLTEHVPQLPACCVSRPAHHTVKPEHLASIQQLISELEATEVFSLVGESPFAKEMDWAKLMHTTVPLGGSLLGPQHLATFLLLTLAPTFGEIMPDHGVITWLITDVEKGPALLANEVRFMRNQLESLENTRRLRELQKVDADEGEGPCKKQCCGTGVQPDKP